MRIRIPDLLRTRTSSPRSGLIMSHRRNPSSSSSGRLRLLLTSHLGVLPRSIHCLRDLLSPCHPKISISLLFLFLHRNPAEAAGILRPHQEGPGNFSLRLLPLLLAPPLPLPPPRHHLLLLLSQWLPAGAERSISASWISWISRDRSTTIPRDLRPPAFPLLRRQHLLWICWSRASSSARVTTSLA